MTLSPRALELILSHEGFSSPPNYPGGESGITIGHGYDLGYRKLIEFHRDWGGKLTPKVMDRLAHVVGLRADAALQKVSTLKDIAIPRDAAAEVFEANSIPWAIRETCKIFEGIEKLPLDAQGALVSVVFNRGAKLSGESRREMRAIQKAVLMGNLPEIASQIREMKRLWIGKKLDGLLRRRDEEAALVESCMGHR